MNERSCRIFLEKLLGSPSPYDPFNELSVKNFRKFFTTEFIEKNFEIFSENSKKKIFCQKKKREIQTIFPGKSDMTFR